MSIAALYKKYSKTTVYQSFLLALTQSIVALFFIGIDFFFSKGLSIEDFGIWKRLIFVVNLAIPILSFGIAEGYKYYLAKEGKRNQMFANTFSFYLLIAGIYFAVVLAANLIGYFGWVDLKEYYLLSFLLPVAYFAFVINKTLRYAYINDSKVETHTKITLIAFAITSAILLLFYFNFKSLISYYLYIGIILYILIYLLPIFSLIKKEKFILTNRWINKDFFVKVLKQGLPLYLATFIGALTLNTGMLIVNTFEDTQTFAIFSVGALEIPVFAMLSTAFSQKIYPDLVKWMSGGEKEKAKKLWMKTTIQISYITYPLIILLMFFAKDIIYLIYSPKYEESVFLFKTYLLIGIFRNNYYGALITAAGQTKYITYYALMMLGLNAVLSLGLYYFWEISGVVFGTLFATITMQLLQLNHEKLLKAYLYNFLLNFKIFVLIVLILLIYFTK
ncbi:MAG: oligosaccharide flippase family protein [Flavobacteriaceae bacterium]|jgi:O-antigen/teichoic acid export membrane protein|nr:oligosaccharide flippase family protein [Flavobacteriaceae bacterium]